MRIFTNVASEHSQKKDWYMCWYDSAHLCIQYMWDTESQVLDLMMHLWSVFYGNTLWVGLYGARASPVVTSGHICPSFGVVTAIATAVPCGWPLNAPGPPGQLSAPFSCNVPKMFKGVMYDDHNTAHVLLIESHLSGTRPVGTLSSYRSLCWSRRYEEGCIGNKTVALT